MKSTLLRTSVTQLPPYTAGSYVKGYIKLSSNESPFGTSGVVRRAIRGALKSVHRYPPPDPHRLRAAIARTHHLTSEWVAVGNGSDEILGIIASAVVDSTHAGIIGAHTFSLYRHVLQLCGGQVVVAPMPSGSFSIATILEHISPATRIIFLCNPNNPSGTYVPRAEMVTLIQKLPDHVLLVLDEAYVDFVSAADFPYGDELVSRYSKVVVVRTFSKMYALAGLRVGYLLANPALTAVFNRIRTPFNCNILAQHAAYAALHNTNRYKRHRAIIIAERERLHQNLSQLGFSPLASQANFICLPLRGSALDFATTLKEHKILIRPLGSFNLPHYARISIGTPAQNRYLLRTLHRLKELGALTKHLP